MYMKILAFYEQAYVFTKYYLEIGKHYMRYWLGPAPQNYYMLRDGQVLPSTTIIPTQLEPTYMYNSDKNHMYLITTPEPEGRFRPLKYISLRIESEIVGNIDISDWLGEIRANPVPILSPKQILNLWAYTHHQYVPQEGATTVFATSNMGEEEVVIV